MVVVPASWGVCPAPSLSLGNFDFDSTSFQGVDTFVVVSGAVVAALRMASWGTDSPALNAGNIVVSDPPYSLDGCWGTAVASSEVVAADVMGIASVGVVVVAAVVVVAVAVVGIVMARMLVVVLCSF